MREMGLAFEHDRPILPIYYSIPLMKKDVPLIDKATFCEPFKNDARVKEGELDRWYENITSRLLEFQGIQRAAFEGRKDADLFIKEEVIKWFRSLNDREK